MAQVIALVILGLGLFFFVRWLLRQPPRVYWQGIGVLVAVGLLFLVATGRAHWITAVVAALIPFGRALLRILNTLPLLRHVHDWIRNTRQPSGPGGDGPSSTVQSRFIRMTLDPGTGDIRGEVLEGRFQGRQLADMPLAELLELLGECRADRESVSLLTAYLDRVHGDAWREQAQDGGGPQPDGGGPMTREEALAILGLGADAGEEEIVRAHKRLIQHLHPDRGGSAYLATRINLAKDTLLDRKA